MTPPFHAVWVDANNDPAYGKFPPYGIDTPYFDAREQRLVPVYLDAVKAHPGIAGCGIFFAWNWSPSFADPVALATYADARLRQIGWLGNPAVCFDIEKGANGVTSANLADYCVAFLATWRLLRPSRPTWLTIEGMQGGNFDPASVAKIVAAKVRVAPQFYSGNMQALGHSVILDLLMAGFPGDTLDGMYDARALPWRWRGFAFTQGSLP